MKKLLLFLFFVSANTSNAQLQKLSFDYDAAGNQIVRQWCTSCHSKTGETPKELKDITENDLQKFYPNDVISYYPNPVKEQLYVKWQLIDNNTVSSIQLYNLNGQLLKEFKGMNGKNDFSISFSNYPQNIYSLNLVYTNGEQKSIKIIKE
jgi:Secretion system C-terminal sorting domain